LASALLGTPTNLRGNGPRGAQAHIQQNVPAVADAEEAWREMITSLEALVSEGWAVARTEPGFRSVPPVLLNTMAVFHENRDVSRLQTS